MMFYLTHRISKPWVKTRVLLYSFHCSDCLRTVIPYTDVNKNSYYRTLHINSVRKSVLVGINNTINQNLVQNKYTSILGPSIYNRERSFHTLIQTYQETFQSISESSAVIATQNFLVYFHETTNLPWWATIAVSTVLFRTVITLPLALYQQYIVAKIENLRLELPAIAKELQKEVEIAAHMYKWTPDIANHMYRRSLKKQWTLLIERDNCHPAKAGIVVLFQLPMWILYSMSIRNLVSKRPFYDEAAEHVFDQLTHEGLLWIPNLTVPDATMVIPCALCLVSLAIVEVNHLMQIQEPTRYKKVITNIFRGVSIITFPLGCIVPSCLSFYWLTSATVGLCQNLMVMSPRLKSLVGVPRTPTTLINPYNHLWSKIQSRFNLLRSSKI